MIAACEWLVAVLSSIGTVDDLPKVGAAAPAFELRDDKNEVVALDELRGKKVVLAFYPKDFTGG